MDIYSRYYNIILISNLLNFKVEEILFKAIRINNNIST